MSVCMYKCTILPGPVLFPGVGMSLALCKNVLNGVGLGAAPPETVG